MPLTLEQQQEFQELRKLEELEQKYGQQKPVSAMTREELINPEPSDPWLREAALGAGLSGGSALGSKVGGGLAALLGRGTTKIGDILMQKAVGLSKRIPGLGEQLAEAGLVGTKGMMGRQTEKGLEGAGKQIGELASKIPGKISQEQDAEKIAGLAGPRITSS